LVISVRVRSHTVGVTIPPEMVADNPLRPLGDREDWVPAGKRNS
jgi:hypothetical protein